MRPEAMREHETSADGTRTLPDVPPAAFDRSLTLDERIMNLAVHSSYGQYDRLHPVIGGKTRFSSKRPSCALARLGI